MTSYHPNPSRSGGNGGPQGQKLLSVSLALLAAILGTPVLFGLIGPIVERLVYEAYGSQDFADIMYGASFVLSGVAIYSIAEMTIYTAITAVIAFGALRFAGFAI